MREFGERERGRVGRSGSCLPGLPPHLGTLINSCWSPSHLTRKPNAVCSSTNRPLGVRKMPLEGIAGRVTCRLPTWKVGLKKERDISEGQEDLQQTPTSILHGNPKDLFTWSALDPLPEKICRLQELASTRPRQPTNRLKPGLAASARLSRKWDSPACACP